MIFSAVVEPRNSGKSAKSCEIQVHVDTHFKTYFGYRGCLIAVNLQIYLEISSPQQANNVPKLVLKSNSVKSTKSRKIHKNMQNSAKFARNHVKYISIHHIWNLSRLLGLFNCHEFILQALPLHHNEGTMSQIYQASLMLRKLGTSHDVKSFVIGSFLERYVVKIANDYLC